MENPSRVNELWTDMTFNCDLDLVSAWLRYGFANPRTEFNIVSKSNENPSMSKGDIGLTRRELDITSA